MTRFTVGRLVVPSTNQPPYASPGSPIAFGLGPMPDVGPTGAGLGVYSVGIKNVGITPVYFRSRNGTAPDPGQSPYSILFPGHLGVAYFRGSPNQDIFIDCYQNPQYRYISFADNAPAFTEYPGLLEIED